MVFGEYLRARLFSIHLLVGSQGRGPDADTRRARLFQLLPVLRRRLIGEGMAFYIKIRTTSDSQHASDAARAYLERLLPGLKLAKGRKGNNPRYDDDPKVLAYGELEIPGTGEPPPGRTTVIDITAPEKTRAPRQVPGQTRLALPAPAAAPGPKKPGQR